ncbi:MAG: 50S ribosomal protein L4 [Patescibacteria group bacterium]
MADKNNPEPVVTETKAADWQVLPETALGDVKVQPQVLREVILALQTNRHHATANTKRRGEVSGGGRKPWRQKGTGRARTGSIRNPLWKGGGIIFGPLKTKNYQQNVPTNLRRQALFGALKLKLDQGKVAVWKLTEPVAKTKLVLSQRPELLEASPILVVVPNSDFKTSLRNLPNVQLVTPVTLNALGVASARRIIFINDTFDQIKARAKAEPLAS